MRNADVVASIQNEPVRQGAFAVYQDLKRQFSVLDTKATEQGLTCFAEHPANACNHPGLRPTIDHLFENAAGGKSLSIDVIAAHR